MISTQVTSKDKKLLDLAGCSVVRGTDRGDGVFGGAFAFAVIAEDGSRLCLQAENEDERLRWVSALRRATGAPLNDFASIGAFQAENPACAECASDEADWVSTCVEINQCVGYTMTWPRRLCRVVRNRHRHAIEQALSRHRVDGVEDDAAIQDERAVNLISTQVMMAR